MTKVDKIIKSVTKIQAQLEDVVKNEEREIVYLQKRLADSNEEVERAKKISDNFQKLLS